jgi:hypothetical protein
MYRNRVALALSLLGAFLVWGCSRAPRFVARYEPWRAVEERACLTGGIVRATPFLQARAGALGGPRPCGALRPLEMTGAAGGRVLLRPAATLGCPMVPAIEQWVRNVVDPAARRYFGMPLAELKVAGSYSCRPRNHNWGGWLSEHGYANAIDISGFVLTDGRTVAVRSGWWGNMPERAFLRAVRRGACDAFTTVLGPGADSYHRDHFHLDLRHHGRDGTGRICQ